MGIHFKKDKLKLLWEIYVSFLKLGIFGFGGGFALVNLMEKEIVEEKKWIDKEQMVDVLGISQCLPGAIALNTSGFVGYSVAKVPGAIAAMLGNITAPVAIVMALVILFQKFSSYSIVQNAFDGIRPSIIALIAYAGYKIGKTSLKDRICVIIAFLAFIGVSFLRLHPILIIVLGALVGIAVISIKESLEHKKKSHSTREGIL